MLIYLQYSLPTYNIFKTEKGMFPPFSMKAGLLFMILTLMELVFCDFQTIIAEMDKKIVEKQANALQKASSLQALGDQNNLLKLAYAEAVQSNTAAESAYRSYFNERVRCQGYNGDLGFIGEVSSLPDDFCPLAPIATDYVDTFTKLLQLENLKQNLTFAENIFNQQKDFNVDVFDELAIYSRLREIAYGPLSAAAQKNRDCLAKYATTTNPDPIECKPFAQAVAKAEAIYGDYRGKEVTFGMSTKTPVFSLQIKNSTLQKALQDYYGLKTSIQPTIDQFKSTQSTCFSNLQNLLTVLNQRLDKARQSREKINAQNDKIAQIQADLDAELAKAKAATVVIQNLATSLKKQFP